MHSSNNSVLYRPSLIQDHVFIDSPPLVPTEQLAAAVQFLWGNIEMLLCNTETQSLPDSQGQI